MEDNTTNKPHHPKRVYVEERIDALELRLARLGEGMMTDLIEMKKEYRRLLAAFIANENAPPTSGATQEEIESDPVVARACEILGITDIWALLDEEAPWDRFQNL